MTRLRATLSLFAACSVAGAAAAQAPQSTARNQCWRSEDFQAFRPIDDRSFYIRVSINEYWRIEMQGTCPELQYPDARLITQVRGSNMICSALDWDLRVGQGGPGGFAVPCIVKSQTRLTAAEVAAIPKKQKP